VAVRAKQNLVKASPTVAPVVLLDVATEAATAVFDPPPPHGTRRALARYAGTPPPRGVGGAFCGRAHSPPSVDGAWWRHAMKTRLLSLSGCGRSCCSVWQCGSARKTQPYLQGLPKGNRTCYPSPPSSAHSEQRDRPVCLTLGSALPLWLRRPEHEHFPQIHSSQAECRAYRPAITRSRR
jgi:hypothetical protein